MRRLTVVLVAGWVLLGLFGAWTYGHDYYNYRGFPPPANPPGIAAGRLERVSFASSSLRQRRSYDIYLPPGYAAAARKGQRFRVLYLLHGAPGTAKLFLDAGHLGVDLDTLVAHRAIRPFLVVMPNGSDGTYAGDTEWSDTKAKGAYESFVMDVVRAVDARWPTVADRSARAIAGNSEGAYGAVNIALRHLDTFSLAQSWSGYFTQTPSGVFAGASPAQLAAASPQAYVGSLRAQIARYPLRAYLYGGRKDPDTRQLAPFSSALASAGARVTSRIYPGRHDWGLWRARTPGALRNVDAVLSPR